MILELLFVSLAWSAPTPQREVQSIAKDFQSTKKTLVKEEVRQRKILSSLFTINKRMKKIVSEKANLDREIMGLEGANEELAKKIDELEEKVKHQKAFLRVRLSAIYKLGGQGIARMLFTSSDSAQLERNLRVLGIVAKRDLDLIKDYSSSMTELESKKAKLTNRLARVERLASDIKTKEEWLLSENNYKTKILDQIKKSQKSAQEKIKGLRQKSAALDDSGLLDLLFRPSFFEQKGNLPWPISAKVTQKFGIMRDEVYNVSVGHKGLFFSAANGTAVKSIFEGKVAFVGNIPGFGKTVILDHGDHYYSVYSHASQVQVREGEEIKQQQTIALSGRADSERGDGLYFEIRHFSEPYDPHQWMKGRSL